MTWVDDNDFARESRTAAVEALGFANSMRFAPDDGTGEAVKGAKSHRTTQTISRNPQVSLEFFEAAFGIGTEDPIDTTRVEPQVVQSVLQRGDVVTVLHVPGAVAEDAVTERPPGTVEATPGGGSDDAVGNQAALLLEGANGSLDVGVEGCVPLAAGAPCWLAGEQTQQGQVVTDLGNGGTVVAKPVRLLRHGTSGALGTSRDVGSP
jgi:hypothetical protein